MSINGPTFTSGSVPLPTDSDFIRAASRRPNSSITPPARRSGSRRTGLAHVAHLRGDHPVDGLVDVGIFENDERRVASEPIDVRRTFSAHCSSSRLPTGVDPVNDNFLARPDRIRGSITRPASVTVMQLTTPAGSPASVRMSISASIDSGVCGAGLITLVHPAAMARANLRVPIAIGKFHGVISRHGPTGWRAIRKRVAGGRALIPTVDPNGLFGEVAEKLPGVSDLAARLSQRFAHFQRHQQCEVVDPLMQKLIRAGEDIARSRGGTAANPAGPRRRLERCPAVCGRRVGDRAQGDTGGRVGDLEGAPFGCVDPFAVDEQSLLDSVDVPWPRLVR